MNHLEKQYLDTYTGATTNEAENYFSPAQAVHSTGPTTTSAKVHLNRYLAEFDFRYSTRGLTDTERMARLMGQVPGRRISYKRVKGR